MVYWLLCQLNTLVACPHSAKTRSSFQSYAYPHKARGVVLSSVEDWVLLPMEKKTCTVLIFFILFHLWHVFQFDMLTMVCVWDACSLWCMHIEHCNGCEREPFFFLSLFFFLFFASFNGCPFIIYSHETFMVDTHYSQSYMFLFCKSPMWLSWVWKTNATAFWSVFF